MPEKFSSFETISTTVKDGLIRKALKQASVGRQWRRTVITEVSAIIDDWMQTDLEVIARDGDWLLACRFNAGEGKFISYEFPESDLIGGNEQEKIQLLPTATEKEEVIELTKDPEQEVKNEKELYASQCVAAYMKLIENDGTWRLVDFIRASVPRKKAGIEHNWEIIAIGSKGCVAWKYDEKTRRYEFIKYLSRDDISSLPLNAHISFPTDTENQNPDPEIKWIRMGLRDSVF